ncbi:MAG: slipin family protein [candidate division NC10 bacterium]|nr:slipin family protein [candidate division NC10 bacterium]MDE2322706.1 slipin family protein [candidate division NC10 bacterium]
MNPVQILSTVFGLVPILFLLILALFILASSVRILPEYERAVIFRLGRLAKAIVNVGGTGNGPGLILLIPMIDRMTKVSLRTVAMDVPSQDVITKDNVSVKVNAVIYFRVIDPERAIVQVENYLFATSQIAQTTLRSVLGQSELDELLAERDRLNQRLQQIIDQHTDPWGIKVTVVEIKLVDLPHEMQRAMAKQAEAEREKRAKIIHAEGELQASEKLAQAGRILATESVTIQLRYLQTLTEIATEKNSTIVFPIPIDILKIFLYDQKKSTQS